MYPFSSKPPVHLNCHITLSRVPFAICSRTLLVINFKHSSVYRLLPNSLTILSPSSSPWQPAEPVLDLLFHNDCDENMAEWWRKADFSTSLFPKWHGSKYSFFYSFLPIPPPLLSSPLLPFPFSFFCCCFFCPLSFSISFFHFCIKPVWTVISVSCHWES